MTWLWTIAVVALIGAAVEVWDRRAAARDELARRAEEWPVS